MASTQDLTELPVIQFTGMDYSSVIEQIKEIIESNSNWKTNWTQFYNSEAGTMLIQLMGWIADNLAVRQDLLYNENFLSTASSDISRRRLLNQIGYVLESPSASMCRISVEFDNLMEERINLSNVRDDEADLTSITNKIFRFYGTDINGNQTTYEILSTNPDGTINYTTPIRLGFGNAYYETDLEGMPLMAVEGKTVFRQFTSESSDGPSFELTDNNIDLKTLVVYDITNNSNTKHLRVDNFLDTSVLNGELINYVVEMTDQGYYRIRYPSEALVTYGSASMKDRLFPAGHTIGVFYRITSGSVGNIAADYLAVTDSVVTENGKSVSATIRNIGSGYNGEDGESLEDAVKNAPLSLTTMNRAVTITDYDRIFKKNDLVLNCKSFSPENSPPAFKRYYGREINPQEIFSFLILNKNFNKIGNAHLNYFPWIELNKESIVNEQYVFGDASVNNVLKGIGDVIKNMYISDGYEELTKKNFSGTEYDVGIDNGQWQYDHYKTSIDTDSGEMTLKARMLRNGKIYKTSYMIGDTIINEKLTKNYEMKVKVHSDTSDALYIDDIENDFLNTTENLTTDNNIIENNEVNATYTSTKGLKSDSKVDCNRLRYIKFVLDDNLEITVDLHRERMTQADIDTEFSKVPDGKYERYYLYIDHTPGVKDADAMYNFEDALNTLYKNKESATWQKKMLEYHNSEDYARHRLGILQLVREAFESFVHFTNYADPKKVPAVSTIKTGTKIATINKFVDAYTYNNTTYLIDSYSTPRVLATTGNDIAATTFPDSGYTIPITDTLKNRLTEQGYMEKACLANGTTPFLDLGLQEETTKNGKYLITNYTYNEGETIKYHSPEQVAGFYRVNINGEIFALRLDAYTAIKAEEHYGNFTETSSSGSKNYFGYYPYIGKGNLAPAANVNKVLTQISKDTIFANIFKNYNAIYSRRSLASYEVESGEAFARSENTETLVDTENVKNTEIKLGQLATMIDYVISPLNKEKETIYRYVNGQWYDMKATSADTIAKLLGIKSTDTNYTNKLYEFRNVLGGKLTAYAVGKANYDTNSCVPLSVNKTGNNFLDKTAKEYDIRFAYINGYDPLDICSVSEREIIDPAAERAGSISTIKITTAKAGKVETKDLLQEVLGYRRKFHSEAVNYLGKSEEVITYRTKIVDENEQSTLKFTSLAKGINSSIYFIQTAQRNSVEPMMFFGLNTGFSYEYPDDGSTKSEYYDRARSDKAYGIRRMEMYVGDEDWNETNIYSGVPVPNVVDLTGNTRLKNNIVGKIATGDIIITDSDINTVNAADINVSFLLGNSVKLAINKYTNFYYSEDEEINEKAKPDIVGIEGQAVNIDENGNYFIVQDRSKFGVKLTKHPVETNSYYAITDDTYNELNIIPNDSVRLETDVIEPLFTDKDSFYRPSGLGYGITTVSEAVLKEAGEHEVPIIFSLDEMTSYCPADGNIFSYKKYIDSVIAFCCGSVINSTGAKLFTALSSKLRSTASDRYIVDVATNWGSIIKKYYNTSNKVIFGGLNRSEEGNITFYYPDASSEEVMDIQSMHDAQNYEITVQLFYKKLFGTNKTNPEFYALYPKEEMCQEGLNGTEIVHHMNGDQEEYFYAPVPGHHLKFIYRGYVGGGKTQSRFGDYYISAISAGSSGFSSGYRYYLNKTTFSRFPDIPFYLHFVNDRTYEYKRTHKGYQTEEDILNEYMQEYKITGTELVFLKPYFKAFDIAGNIRYNANYDISTVRSNVETTLEKKYHVSSIEDITVGNTVYRSDIFRTILEVEGVESVDIDYFGYDYTNQDKYPDQKYSLNTTSDATSKSGSDFFIISVLADTSSTHGLLFTYEKSGAEAAEI